MQKDGDPNRSTALNSLALNWWYFKIDLGIRYVVEGNLYVDKLISISSIFEYRDQG